MYGIMCREEATCSKNSPSGKTDGVTGPAKPADFKASYLWHTESSTKQCLQSIYSL